MTNLGRITFSLLVMAIVVPLRAAVLRDTLIWFAMPLAASFGYAIQTPTFGQAVVVAMCAPLFAMMLGLRDLKLDDDADEEAKTEKLMKMSVASIVFPGVIWLLAWAFAWFVPLCIGA